MVIAVQLHCVRQHVCCHPCAVGTAVSFSSCNSYPHQVTGVHWYCSMHGKAHISCSGHTLIAPQQCHTVSSKEG